MNIVSRRWETCLAPHRQVLDEEKLKFFSSKISIWDHFSMDGASHKSLSTEEKTALVDTMLNQNVNITVKKQVIFVLCYLLTSIFGLSLS